MVFKKLALILGRGNLVVPPNCAHKLRSFSFASLHSANSDYCSFIRSILVRVRILDCAILVYEPYWHFHSFVWRLLITFAEYIQRLQAIQMREGIRIEPRFKQMRLPSATQMLKFAISLNIVTLLSKGVLSGWKLVATYTSS